MCAVRSAEFSQTAHEHAMSETRVAVVIPCYNDGRFLCDAASLREQEPCDVVVIDDGSNEAETLTVVDELEAEGAPVIHQGLLTLERSIPSSLVGGRGTSRRLRIGTLRPASADGEWR